MTLQDFALEVYAKWFPKTETKMMEDVPVDAPADAPADAPVDLEPRVVAIEDAIKMIIEKMDELIAKAAPEVAPVDVPVDAMMSEIKELKTKIETLSAAPKGEIAGKEVKLAKEKSNLKPAVADLVARLKK